MRHIDEHTIELYVLGSEFGENQIAEIEAHFRECYGCRSLATEIRGFYREFEKNLETLPIPNVQKTDSLLKIQNELLEYQIPLGSRVPSRPITALGRFFYAIYKHPIPTAVGGVVTMALLGVLVFWGVNDAFKDTNPSYTHLNSDAAVVEVYNKDHKMLWSFPSPDIYRVAPKDYAELSTQVIATDLNGDKKNEVLTFLAVGKRTSPLSSLTMFSPTGKILREIAFKEYFQFRGAKYAEALGVQYFSCVDIDNSGNKELIVVTNNGRSPNIIYRLSSDGEILGEYFHFGLVKTAALQDDVTKRTRIILFGRNDVNDPDSLSFPIMIVLDPLKIIGITEASDSRGFGLPLSPAEEFVIRYPLSDLNYIVKSNAYVSTVQSIMFNGIPSLQLDVIGDIRREETGTGNYPIFWYIMTTDFRMIEVKYEAHTNRVRQQFVDQGKLSGSIDKIYLIDLKNGVRYWNGQHWQREWAGVLNSPVSKY